MTADQRDLISWVLGTLTTVAILVAAAVRLVLVPYLRDHLVQPVKDVHRQVTENHHSNAEPTLPDLLDDVKEQVAGTNREVHALASVVEGHLTSSDRWLNALIRRLDIIEDAVRRHHPD